MTEILRAAGGVHVAYSWDLLDRPAGIVWRKSDGDILRSFGYSYDMAGNITNVTAQGAGMPRRDVAYGYDMLDRLTSVSVYTNLQPTASSLSTFSYDLADNRTNATHNGIATACTLGVGDRLASTSDGATYLYSAAGCVTNISSVLPVPSVVSLHWNSRYQLTAAYTNGVLAESYQYDALGRRISTTSGGTTTCHVYDGGWQVLADLDASGRPLRSYTWGPGIDSLLAMTTYGSTTNTYYAITDHLGTVHALVDATGDIAESYEFDAWGNLLAVYDASGTPISNRQSAIGNRYLFQGREHSFTTGLYHFRHRWYDPLTGRWLSNDPIGISGGLNQYVFCGDNPIAFADASGLDPSYRFATVADDNAFALAVERPTGSPGKLNFIQLKSATNQRGSWKIDAKGVLGTALKEGAINVPPDFPYYFDNDCEQFGKYQILLFDNLKLANLKFDRARTTIFADSPFEDQYFVLLGVIEGDDGGALAFGWSWQVIGGKAKKGGQIVNQDVLKRAWSIVRDQAPKAALHN